MEDILPYFTHMPTKAITKLTPLRIALILGLVLLGLIAASFALRILQPMLQDLSNTTLIERGRDMYATDAVAPEMAVSRGIMADGGASMTSIPYPPLPETPPAGSDAEKYEVTSYNVQVETADLETTCGTLQDLKQLEDVIFTNADKNDRQCFYAFKVAKASTQEVLNVLREMQPKTLNENIRTIQKVLERYESQEELLKIKAETIEATFNEAVTAYDELAQTARTADDIESLTKVMTSKLELVQRLTNERIQNNAELERLALAKAEQADQLLYTNFSVRVTEDTYINGKDIQESWDEAIKGFFLDMNGVAQGLTIGFIAFLLMTVQYGLYFIVLLFITRFGWRFAKDVWNK